MINSNDGGANVSVDFGETWTGEGFPTAQLYHVATTTDVPYHVCGAQQDNTTICVTSAPAGRGGGGAGSTLELGRPVYSPGGGESGYIAPIPRIPTFSTPAARARSSPVTIARPATCATSRSTRCSSPACPRARSRNAGSGPSPSSSIRSIRRFSTPRRSISGSTTNEGQSWQMISPDLTKADPKTLGDSGGPITKDQNGPEIYATIFTIAPSPKDVNTIWTGSDDGLVYITRDGGKNWKNITPKDLPDLIRISIIDASPNKPGTAYLAAKNYQADDRRPYAYRTDDYGAHLDQDRQRHPQRRLRARGPRRSQATRPSVRRNRTRHLRFLRQRRRMAIDPPESARYPGPRSVIPGRRPGHRHARPFVLHPRRHFACCASYRAASSRPCYSRPGPPSVRSTAARLSITSSPKTRIP